MVIAGEPSGNVGLWITMTEHEMPHLFISETLNSTRFDSWLMMIEVMVLHVDYPLGNS